MMTKQQFIDQMTQIWDDLTGEQKQESIVPPGVISYKRDGDTIYSFKESSFDDYRQWFLYCEANKYIIHSIKIGANELKVGDTYMWGKITGFDWLKDSNDWRLTLKSDGDVLTAHCIHIYPQPSPSDQKTKS